MNKPITESKETLLPTPQQMLDCESDDSVCEETQPDWEHIFRRHGSIKQRKTRQWIQYFIMATALSIFIVALLLYTYSSGFDTSILQDTEWKHCGNTTEEARRNGCVLDFIAGAWVHPACYDAELEEEFFQLDDWHWYADTDGQHELSKAFIRETGGPSIVHVSMNYHRQHCAYTWRKLHRALIRQSPIDTHIGGYAHTVHCSGKLAAPDPAGTSKFFHIFTSCRMPQDFHLDEITP